jgi:hypothetical protein
MEIIERIPQLTNSHAMKKTSNVWLFFWRGISFAALIHLIAFDLLILNAPEMLQVQFTPDDGYYYLTLTRNFVRFGQWTFDGGVSVTSGFPHPALCSGWIYKLLQPTLDGFVRLGLGFDALITLIAVCIAWWICLRKNDAFHLIAFTILVTAKPFLFNSVSVTEWPLVILIAGLYCLSFYQQEKSHGAPLALFVLGLLGSLARSDFGLLPFGIFISALFMERGNPNKPLARESLVGVLGAVLGLGLVFVHNFVTTGTFIQSSALMKSYQPFVHQKFYNAMALILKVIGLDLGFADFDRSIFLLGVLLISGPLILIVLAKRSGQKDVSFSKVGASANQPLRERVLVRAAAFCLLGYSIFYAYNGAIQHWYTANLTWPIFILLVAGAHYLDQRLLKEGQFTLIWLSVFALMALVVQISSLYPLRSQTSPWPHQQVMLEAGRYLAQHPLDGYVGSWNSGVVGYYRDAADIINIDGLVNNDIYPYAVGNSLPDYLREKNIGYILDFENMLHPPFPERGGYDDANFLSQLEPVKEFDQGQFEEFKFLRLYRIKQ